MEDKIICITGGNDGIGWATALALAKKGSALIIAGRNESRVDKAIKNLIRDSGNKRIFPLKLDLSDFASIREAASTLLNSYPHLDVLINNAATFLSSYEETAQGFERQIGVNYFGPFLFTRLLLDHLRKASSPRVINVSSDAHYSGKIIFERFRQPQGSYNGMDYYRQSKLANVLFTKEFVRRHPEVEAFSLHPGVVRTRFVNKQVNGYYSLVWNLIKLFSVSPERGARTSVFLASAKRGELPNGAYFGDNQRAKPPSASGQNTELARELWEQTEHWIKKL